MNKIDNFAYLFAVMMESDGKVNIKELDSWYKIVEKRWTDVPKEEAGNALKNALYIIKSQDQSERLHNLEKVLKDLKSSLQSADLDNLAKVAADAIENAVPDPEERSWSWSNLFYSEPPSKYTVSQQSWQEVELTTVGLIRRALGSVFSRALSLQEVNILVQNFDLS